MQYNLFEEFIESNIDELRNKPNSKRISIFVKWCSLKNIEELILRLSSEDKNGLRNNMLLEFTNTRILIRKKNIYKKLIDVGYVTGFAPVPYIIITKNLENLSDKEKRSILDKQNKIFNSESTFEYSISYSDIKKCTLRIDFNDTKKINMLGRVWKANLLNVDTFSKTFQFTLPVTKNGTFEQISFWLNSSLPIEIN